MNVMEGNHIVSAKHAVINNLHSFKLIADMNISETPKIFIGSDIQWNFSNITEVYIGHLMIISEKKGWGSVHAWSPPSLNGTLTIDSCELDNVLTVLTYTNLVLKGSVSFSKTTSRLDSPFEGTIFVIRGTMTTDALGSVTLVHSQTPIFSCFSSVILTGSITFENNSNTAIIAYSSSVTMSGNISLTNNTGIQGGAMQLHSSRLNIGSGTNVFFSGNTASETGGAIYVDYPSLLNNGVPFKTCFYRLLNYNEEPNYNLTFIDNKASLGGDHIYGASMKDGCTVTNSENTSAQVFQKFFHFMSSFNSSLSAVSSDVKRLCKCNSSGYPQCTEILFNLEVHPGELFSLSVAIVGGDFGTTVGTVFAHFLSSSKQALKVRHQYSQAITNPTCEMVNYTLLSKNTHEILYLDTYQRQRVDQENYADHKQLLERDLVTVHHPLGIIGKELRVTPIFVNITLIPCPLGFTLMGDPPGCDCFPILTQNNVMCSFSNGTGYVLWSGPLWIGQDNSSDGQGIIFGKHCPFDYCELHSKHINLEIDANAQCAYNHAGILCGGCKKGYSLAIGSSFCVKCSNNSMALLIFFVAAGFLLVFFIGALDLTITEGTINGLIFYANIVWTYQSLLLPQDQSDINIGLLFLQGFVAWLNLDFGIQSCFFSGLDAYWKTWLQFVFPIYVLCIAGFMILVAKHSTLLTKLFGNHAVPILATLIFLSYTKLLRTTIVILQYSHLNTYPNESTVAVWSLDGHYTYGHFPHILLLLVALVTLLVLCLPYTLFLLIAQWLRKVSHFRLLRWISRLDPVLDAHFASLKDKRHYWFGLLLTVRVILVIILSSSGMNSSDANLFMLLIVVCIVTVFLTYQQLYKRIMVILLETFILLNLIFFIGGTLAFDNNLVVTYILLSLAFITFCGIVIHSLLNIVSNKLVAKCRIQRNPKPPSNEDDNEYDTRVVEHSYSRYRDSILNDTHL